MISAVVLAKNEQKSIARCLKSLSFCDEILVVDDYSTDNTVEVAKKQNAKVIEHSLNNNFGAQRNFAIEKVNNDWILFIDADEVVSEKLKIELSSIFSTKHQVPSTKYEKYLAYLIPRRDFFWGRELKYGETQTARSRGIIRLVKRDSGKWIGEVHEKYITEGTVGKLSGFIDHYPHPTIVSFLIKINDYSSKRAEELDKSGVKQGIALMLLTPLFKFIYTYFVKLGFLDGPSGFVYSFMMSFHSFLVRSKLYVHQKAGVPFVA